MVCAAASDFLLYRTIIVRVYAADFRLKVSVFYVNYGSIPVKEKEDKLKMKKRILSLLLVLVMLVGLMPTAALAAGGDPATQVHVIVENTTFTAASEASEWQAPKWSGKAADTWITLENDMTMMDCIVAALTEAGYTQTGAENGYISDIGGVAEFDNGEKSGWMGTLNDWFTNKGFNEFGVANGKLHAGDEIRVMYTSTGYGEDLGADWSNSDKRVKSLAFSFENPRDKLSNHAIMVPAFSPDVHDYELIVRSDSEKIENFRIVPTAKNKQYQVHTDIDNVEYRPTDLVKELTYGSVITVRSGDPSWETANPNTAPAEVYTIRVVHPASGLRADDLHIKTIKEAPNVDKETATVKSNEYYGSFSVRLKPYTQNKTYNDAGFEVSLTPPEGASAVLLDQNGQLIGDFKDGPITQNNCMIYSGRQYFIKLTLAEGSTEYYPLTFSKQQPLTINTLEFQVDSAPPGDHQRISRGNDSRIG